MSIDGEKKKFVIRHTFTDVKNMQNREMHHGKSEMQYGIPWKICMYPILSSSRAHIYLFCEKPLGDDKQWSIDTTNSYEIVSSTGEKLAEKSLDFSNSSVAYGALFAQKSIREHLVDGNLTFECQVTINKMTGIEIPMEKRIFRNFEDESAKKFSDIVFSVKDQKFYVNKMYLASHSSYFESLLYGNFNESKQSEIELKDIEPQDFQKFLEVLYGDPDINDETVKGILQLADMYDVEMVIRHCEKFLVNNSFISPKGKFIMAIQYRLNNLKKKCMSELKNVEDIDSVVLEDSR